MSPLGFESTTSAGERPQTYALDRAVFGTGKEWSMFLKTKQCLWDHQKYSACVVLFQISDRLDDCYEIR